MSNPRWRFPLFLGIFLQPIFEWSYPNPRPFNLSSERLSFLLYLPRYSSGTVKTQEVLHSSGDVYILCTKILVSVIKTGETEKCGWGHDFLLFVCYYGVSISPWFGVKVRLKVGTAGLVVLSSLRLYLTYVTTSVPRYEKVCWLYNHLQDLKKDTHKSSVTVHSEKSERYNNCNDTVFYKKIFVLKIDSVL